MGREHFQAGDRRSRQSRHNAEKPEDERPSLHGQAAHRCQQSRQREAESGRDRPKQGAADAERRKHHHHGRKDQHRQLAARERRTLAAGLLDVSRVCGHECGRAMESFSREADTYTRPA